MKDPKAAKAVKEVQKKVEEEGEVIEVSPRHEPLGYRINICLKCIKGLGLKVKVTVEDGIIPDLDFSFGEDDEPEGFFRCHLCGETIYSHGKDFS